MIFVFKCIRSIKWRDVKNGKPNNSDIVSNELKWSLKNVKCYVWWRSIGIESFERKCIRSYALNWGYFSMWCDGNLGDKRSDKMFQFNRFVFCFVFCLRELKIWPVYPNGPTACVFHNSKIKTKICVFQKKVHTSQTRTRRLATGFSSRRIKNIKKWNQ